MGKGSKRRKTQVADKQFMENWAKIFGNEKAHKPQHKAGCMALVPGYEDKCNCGVRSES
tara:strand:+ start:76 stop:252 length:177 start_codon:yes stop_codon:yes gene_type:complete